MFDETLGSLNHSLGRLYHIYIWFITTLASQEYESSPIKLLHLIVKLHDWVAQEKPDGAIELFRLQKENRYPPKNKFFSSMKLHFRKDLK